MSRLPAITTRVPFHFPSLVFFHALLHSGRKAIFKSTKPPLLPGSLAGLTNMGSRLNRGTVSKQFSFKQINVRRENIREVPRSFGGARGGRTNDPFLQQGGSGLGLQWSSLVIGKSHSLAYQNSPGPLPLLFRECFLKLPQPPPLQAAFGFLTILSPAPFPVFFFSWWAPGVAVSLSTCLVAAESQGLNKNQDCSRLSPRRQCNLSNSEMPIGVKDLGKAENWASNKRLGCRMSLWSKLLRSINWETVPVAGFLHL